MSVRAAFPFAVLLALVLARPAAAEPAAVLYPERNRAEDALLIGAAGAPGVAGDAAIGVAARGYMESRTLPVRVAVVPLGGSEIPPVSVLVVDAAGGGIDGASARGLTQFLLSGIGVAIVDGAGEDFAAVAARLLPGGELRDIPPGHPIRNVPSSLVGSAATPAGLKAVAYAGRERLFLLRERLGLLSSTGKEGPGAVETARNFIAYAIDAGVGVRLLPRSPVGVSARVKDGALALSFSLRRGVLGRAGMASDGELQAFLSGPDGAILAQTSVVPPRKEEAEVPLSLPLPEDADIVGMRLAVRLICGPEWERTYALVDLLGRVDLRVLASDRFVAGGTAAVRIVATVDGAPLAGADVEAAVAAGDRRDAASSTTDARGTASLPVSVDRDAAGAAKLSVRLRSERGFASFEAAVVVASALRVLIATDKPLYRPGDEVRMRLLALRLPDLAPASGEAVWTVEDPRGNRLLRRVAPISAQGASHAEVALDAEATTGTWRVRVEIAGALGELPFDVRPYVVPKDALGGEPGRAVGAPVLVRAVPESGEPVAGVENIIYVLATAPDGVPVVGRFQALVDGKGAWTSETDPLGAAVLRAVPAAPALKVDGTFIAADGTRVPVAIDLAVPAPAGTPLLLRADRAFVRAGDPLLFTVLSPGAGPVYLDLVRDGQTVWTGAADLADGRATIPLVAGPDLIGTLVAHAYRIDAAGRLSGDSRAIHCARASSLKIGLSLDRPAYRPGEEARLSVSVTDEEGKPTAAAVGLSGVDETAPRDEPDARLFFTLERRILGAIDLAGRPAEAVASASAADAVSAEAGLILSAASDAAVAYAVDSRYLPAREGALRRATIASVAEAARRLAASLAVATGSRSDVDLAGLTGAGDLFVKCAWEWGGDARLANDPWGTPFVCVPLAGEWALIRSWGPDRLAATADDVAGVVRVLSAGRSLAPVAYLGAGDGKRARQLVEAAWDFTDVPLPEKPGTSTGDAAPKPVGGIRGEAGPGIADSAMVEAALPATKRKFFPETLAWNPEVVTGDDGTAEVAIPLAESIATWRIEAVASDSRGAVGTASASLRVFQAFSAACDLPAALTRGDEVSVPVAIRNRLDSDLDVALAVEAVDGLEATGAREGVIRLGPREAASLNFGVRATKAGRGAFVVRATAGDLVDVLRREVEVGPDGDAIEVWTDPGKAEGFTATVALPAEAIEGTAAVRVRVFPSALARAVDGLDLIAESTGGPVEAAAATAHLGALVLGQMARLGVESPSVRGRAEGAVARGVRRLAAYEAHGGGFPRLPGGAADAVVSIRALAALRAAGGVSEVGAALIERTAAWVTSHGGDISDAGSRAVAPLKFIAQLLSEEPVPFLPAAGEVSAEVGDIARSVTLAPGDGATVREIEFRDAERDVFLPVKVRFAGEGSPLVQVATRYAVPWRADGEETGDSALVVRLDRTALEVGETATVTVEIPSALGLSSRVTVVDVGLPPGFVPRVEDLDALRVAGRVGRCEASGNRVRFYLDGIAHGKTPTWSFRAEARLAGLGRAPSSHAYACDDPLRRASSPPIAVEVGE